MLGNPDAAVAESFRRLCDRQAALQRLFDRSALSHRGQFKDGKGSGHGLNSRDRPQNLDQTGALVGQTQISGVNYLTAVVGSLSFGALWHSRIESAKMPR